MKIKNNSRSLLLHSWRGLVILSLLLLSFGNKQLMMGQNNALVLNGAYIILDGGTQASNIYMVVDQANTSGITRPGGGHINSEGQYNFVKWVSGTNTGNYVFPFGVGGVAADYIPFTFNKTSVSSSNLGMSTWTTNQQNLPHPTLSNVGAVTNMTGVPDSVVNAIDRFWDIQSPTVTGDLTFSYRGSENTTMFPADTFKAQHWNGTSWDIQAGPGNPGVVAGIGTVGPIPNQSTFSPWVLDRIALKATVVSQNSVCGNQCTASATVTPLYGLSAYSYLWSDGQTTPVAINLCAGTYTCVVTDLTNATTSVTVTITSNPVPVLTAVTSQTACAGTNVNAINYTTTPVGSVNWTNTNANTGIAASGTGDISGYPAPNVAVTETGVVTATPIDGITGCVGTPETFTIVVNPTPIVSGIPTIDTAKCGAINGGVSGGLTVNGGTPIYHYQWYNGSTIMTGDTLPTLTNVAGGSYNVQITDANGCVATGGTTSFTIPATTPVTAGFNPSVSQGQAPLDVSFTNTSTGATFYNWDLGNGLSNQTNPNTTYTTAGTYTVVLIASNGSCSDTISAKIIVDVATSIVIPNIFSPNGDGLNDEFIITCTGMKSLHCDIFNRWGQLVFTLTGPNQSWDGRLNNGNQATEGTYYFMLTATGNDSKTYSYQGPITLVK